jgi:hypothetical protein
MLKLTLAVLITASAMTGCASKMSDSDNPYANQQAAVTVPTRVAHEFYNSWGHDGRGGAALRKPTYQHVMGSEDMVMTTQGNYKELRAGSASKPTGSSVVVTALNKGMDQAITTALNSAPALETTPPQATNAGSDGRLASLKPTLAEYERAYRKFCNGAGLTMTEREWEIVALGGPKGIPASMRGKCMHSK